jgi:hypothetical protein
MADTTTMLQEQVLHSVKTAQEATLKIAREWTRILGSQPLVPEFTSMPKPETFYAFGEKLWGAQKEFFVGLLEVATEAGKTVPENFKRTAERSASAASPK